jgi:hypothetical protein
MPISPIDTLSTRDDLLQQSSASRSSHQSVDTPTSHRRNSNALSSLDATKEEPTPADMIDSKASKDSLPKDGSGLLLDNNDHASLIPHARTESDMSDGHKAKLPTTSARATIHKRAVSDEDQLERQISSILTTIPTNIRLASRHEQSNGSGFHVQSKRPAPTPGQLTPAKHRSSIGKRSNTPTTPSRESSQQPLLTLAPAKQSTPTRHLSSTSISQSSDADSGVKLYHLTQPGLREPIKLFVRLVGEDGSRVMVRVGGGWADLGDYLRQFAEHHGRRTVSSEGKVELMGIDGRRTPSGNILTTASDGSGSGSSHRSRIPGRANSAFDATRDSPSGSDVTRRPGSSGGGSINSLKTRPSPLNERMDTVEAASPGTPTPSVAGPEGISVHHATPSSTSSTRRSTLDEDVPLSGPSVKREMSAEKQRWVEDMLGKAKKASTEQVEKMGGTRRVAFRGLSSGAGSPSVKYDQQHQP